MRPRVIFSPKYDVDYGDYKFAARKFSLTAKALAPAAALIEPDELSRDDLLLAHDPVWTDKVLSGKLSAFEVSRLELPFSPAISLAHRLAVGGTVLAARHALEAGIGLHCGGGAHHAFRDHGEGYCALNDIAIAILKLRAEKKLERAAVIDLDVHQGNGTASIFARDEKTFTFSMHQSDLYPELKEKSSLDVELNAGTGDVEYYDKLRSSLRHVFDSKPDLVIYQAGVDVWENDTLGGLKLTERGILDRDTAVWEACLLHRVPVVVTLGGGYGPTPQDTARLHERTLRLFAGLPLTSTSSDRT
jgi:acetoin utilization deacetylase AcuC-like enzyme